MISLRTASPAKNFSVSPSLAASHRVCFLLWSYFHFLFFFRFVFYVFSLEASLCFRLPLTFFPSFFFLFRLRLFLFISSSLAVSLSWVLLSSPFLSFLFLFHFLCFFLFCFSCVISPSLRTIFLPLHLYRSFHSFLSFIPRRRGLDSGPGLLRPPILNSFLRHLLLVFMCFSYFSASRLLLSSFHIISHLFFLIFPSCLSSPFFFCFLLVLTSSRLEFPLNVVIEPFFLFSSCSAPFSSSSLHPLSFLKISSYLFLCFPSILPYIYIYIFSFSHFIYVYMFFLFFFPLRSWAADYGRGHVTVSKRDSLTALKKSEGSQRDGWLGWM